MNNIIKAILMFCLIVIAGCSQDAITIPEQHVQEGEEITVSFTTIIPEFKTVVTRANGGVNDMYLLVFDENGNYIARRAATLSGQTSTGGTFKAQLPSSTNKRIIHFISNYDWEGFNDTPGLNEAAVVAILSTQNVTFWSRVELNNGISATSFSGVTVSMLRNQAKISVINEAAELAYDGFTIHNTPNRGTVAPYSSTTGFAEGTITEPLNVTLTSAQIAGISTDEKYLFERKNAYATNISTVIVKGTYSGQQYYYKIDLIDADKNRYDIERNYHYIVKIQTVTRAGYTNFEDALSGASHNNTALDPIIEKYPIISDGKSKLEVEKTLVILTQPNQQFSVWAKYFPEMDSEVFDNSEVSVSLQSNNTSISGSINFDSNTGVITATGLNLLPLEQGEARIIVTKGDLARTIRVVLRTPFEFDPITINNQNPATITNGQNIDATLKFNIPDDFPEDLFPLPIRIYTNGLYPAAAGLEMLVEGDQIHYIYRATQSGEQTVEFKTNKSNNEEVVALKADYFADGMILYHPNTIKINGTIQYNRRYYSWLSWRNEWSNVSNNATVTISGITGASIVVSPTGQYTFTVPYTTDNPNITFTYSDSNGMYTQQISLSDLKTNTAIRLDWVN